MSELLAPGKYPAKTNAKMVVYEAESGSLCVAVPLNALSQDGTVIWSGKTTITLGNKDGVLNTRAIDNLKKCFPDWDSTNPFGLEDIEPATHDLEIVGEHDQYTPQATDENPDPQPITVFRVKWLNPPGGGGVTMKEPLGEADRKKVLTKWGGKFKAVSGKPALAAAKPAASAAPAKSATPSRPAAVTPPSRGKTATKARTSSQEESWAAFKKANADTDDNELAEKYYAAQDEVAPNANGELTPEQWGEVMTKLGV